MAFIIKTETAGGTWVGSVDEKTGLYHGQGKMTYPPLVKGKWMGIMEGCTMEMPWPGGLI